MSRRRARTRVKRGARPSPPTGAHHCAWIVRGREHGPTCECGANLPVEIRHEQAERARRRAADEVTPRIFRGFL